MSSESNVGGGNAHNDGQRAVANQQYSTENDNSMVEYRVLDSAFSPPDSHEHVTANRYQGPAGGKTSYEQLAGQGAIELVGDTTTETPEPDDFRDGCLGWIIDSIGNWKHPRQLYETDQPTREARKVAVNQLGGKSHEYGEGDFEFVALSDTDELHCFNPTTGVYEENAEQVVGTVLEKNIGSHYSISEKREIVARLKDRHRIERDKIGQPEGKVCVGNGVLDLSNPSNPTLSPHDPRYGFLRSLSVSYNEEEDCPKFKQFIGDVCRPEDIPKLKEYAGYLLHAWGQPYRKALCILGPTDAGKGVFLRVLRQIVGSDNVATETLYSIAQTRWGTANLHGKVVNIANELAQSGLKNAETFKAITGGGDQITAERKGQDPFTFVPTAKHVFATNQVPSVDNADEAFYNRWLFVTFPQSVPSDEQIDNYGEKLVDAEAAGILNWMIEGYSRLRSQGHFSAERGLGDKEDMWADYGDSTDRFVSQCLEINNNPDNELAKKDVYTAYTAFCEDRGMVPEKTGPFTSELKAEGVVQGQSRTVQADTVDKSRVRVYRGVAFTDEGEEYLSDVLNNSEGGSDGDTNTRWFS